MEKLLVKEKMINNLLNYTKTQLHIHDDINSYTIDDKIENIADLIKIAKKYKNDSRPNCFIITKPL